jgi:hypothetical protein
MVAEKKPELTMTPEIRAAIDKLEAATAAEIDDPAVAAELRRGAEDHAEILRRSRELGNRRVYR